MESEFYFQLFLNVSVVLLATLFFGIFQYIQFKNPTIKNLAIGVFFSITSIIAMQTPLELHNGVIVDSRTPLTALSGYYGGVYGAAISFIITALYRLQLGGVGTQAGVIVILMASVIGCFYYYKDKSLMGNSKYSFYSQVFFAVKLAFFAIISIFMLPMEIASPLFKKMWLPIGIYFILVAVTFISVINVFLEKKGSITND